MPATPIEATTRYFLPGTTDIVICPTIANLATGATRAELNAGTEVANEVASISGWQITSENVATPDLGRRFVSQVTGRLTASNSMLQFYADKAGADIRDLLTLDLETNVVFLDGGDVADSPMDCFKVTVASVGKLREIEGVGRIDISFTIRDFAENLSVPAVV